MRTFGAEAIELEEAFESSPVRELDAQPSFEVVTGGGLDSRARAGVSSEFLARVKAVIATAILLFVLGTIRVALTSATVTLLTENVQLREQIMSFETNNDNLRVERSLMSSATRIDRIATQNYGMVAPEDYDVIVIPHETEGEELVDEADAAEAGDAVSDQEAPADGSAEDGGSSFDASQLAAGL